MSHLEHLFSHEGIETIRLSVYPTLRKYEDAGALQDGEVPYMQSMVTEVRCTSLSFDADNLATGRREGAGERTVLVPDNGASSSGPIRMASVPAAWHFGLRIQ